MSDIKALSSLWGERQNNTEIKRQQDTATRIQQQQQNDLPTLPPLRSTNDFIKSTIEKGVLPRNNMTSMDTNKPTEEEKRNLEISKTIKSNPRLSIPLSGLGGIQKGQTWGLYSSATTPEDKTMMEFAKDQHPYLNMGGEIAGFATSLPAKALGGILGIGGKLLGKVVPNAISSVVANPYVQNATKTGIEMAGFNTTSTGADIKRAGGNLSDNIPTLASAAGQGFLGGAVLGTVGTALGQVGKNLYGNTVGFNKALLKTGESIDNYQLPQIRELQTAPRPEIKSTINPTLPLKYQRPLPKTNTPLLLGEGRTPPIVQPQFRTEMAGDVNRPIKGQQIQSTESILKPLNTEGNIKSSTINNVPSIEPLNSNELKLVDMPTISPKPKYSPEIQTRLDDLESTYQQRVANQKKAPFADPLTQSKALKGMAMEHSANKRMLIQGDSLIQVDGGLTPNELSKRLSDLRTNYKGKDVITPDGEGKVKGVSFGKIQIEYANGEVRIYAKEQIQSKVNIDDVISQQKQATVKPVERENMQSNINSPLEENIPTKNQTIANIKTPMEQSLKPIVESHSIPIQPSRIDTIQPEINTPLKESAVKTNTIKNLPETNTPEGEKFYKELDATYGVKTDESSIERANQMLTDYKGTFDRIMQNGISSKEENIAAFKIFRDLESANDFNTANRLIMKIRPIITDSAQIVQSMATIPKDSLAGIAMNARKIIDSMANKMTEGNPNIMNQIKNESVIIKDVLGKNLKLLKINLQLFAESADKDLKQALGKLYNKDYINSIIKLAQDGKYNEETLTNAIKQKYGVPTFDGADLENIANIYRSLENVPKNTWDYKAGMDNIDKIIRDKLPQSLSSKLSTYQFINLYLNTITPLKILGGNITSVTMEYAKNLLRHAIDVAIPGKTVTEMPSVMTQLKSIGKRTKETFKDYRNEVDTDPFILSHDFDMNHGLNFKNKFMRGAEKLTKFVLSVSESPYKQAIYDDELRMLMKKSNVAEPTEEMINQAMEQAQKVMFANSSKMSDAVQGLRGGINKATNSGLNKLLPKKFQIQDTSRFGLGNLVQPVIKTPINMVARAAEYSPLNMLTIRNRAQFVDKTAKAIIGSVFGIGAGYAGKKSGLVSGGVPKDSDARNYAEDAGRQPYALNLGGRSWDVNYIQPFGMLLSFGAELASERKEKEWYSPMIAAMDSLLNQGMMTGFAKLMGQSNSWTSSTGLSENIADAVTSGANTMVPLGAAQNQVSKLIDPYKRETGSDNLLERNLLNRTMARTPLRLTLPPKINNQGENIKEDSWYNTLLMPGKSKEIKNDPVTNEVMRLYDQSNQTKQFPPKANDEISYTLSKGGKSQKATLNPQQLSNYKTLLGQSNLRAIEKVIQSPEYQLANDKQKSDLISNAMSKNKQESENTPLKSQGINEYQSKPSLSRNRSKR